jgi:hypothetical protein
VPTVDAELEGEGERGIRDASERTQHPALVVLLGGGHAGPQEELAAVAVDVGREQRHALRLKCLLDPRHEGVEALAEHLVPLVAQDRVGPREADERDRRDAVLRVRWARCEVLPKGHGEKGAQEGLIGVRHRGAKGG